MEALLKRSSLFLAGLIFMAGAVSAQDVDDMYFNKKDRKKLNEQNMVINKKLPGAQDQEATEYVYKNENAYSEEHVNPEYLARYGNTSSASAADEEYYTEQVSSGGAAPPPVINNYYNNYPVSGFYPSMYMGSMYSPWGWGSTFGLGFSYGWGRPAYGYRPYDPFYDPFYGSGWNTGWNVSVGIGFGWGFGSPYYASRYGYGYGFPGYGYPGYGYGGYPGYGFYCPPGYGNNIVVINNYESRYNRTYRAGSGPSRSSMDRVTRRDTPVAGTEGDGFSSRTSSYGKAATASRMAATSTPTRRHINSDTRTVSQSDYYRRSQASRTVSNDVVTTRTSRTSRSAYSSPTSNYSTRSRVAGTRTPVTRSTSGVRPATTRSAYSARPSMTPTYRSRSSSNTGRSYNMPSSGSYNRSTPSRNSGRSYQRSSSPSRSSGSYRSSSPSRSSGSMRSSSPSRSSSGSRSSGSSRSSSGSRRSG